MKSLPTSLLRHVSYLPFHSCSHALIATARSWDLRSLSSHASLPKSLHCSTLSFLPSLFLFAQTVTALLPFSSLFFPILNLHMEVRRKLYFLNCFVVQALAAAICQPSAFAPSLAHSCDFSFLSIPKSCSSDVAFISFLCGAAFLCFTSKPQPSSAHSSSNSHHLIQRSASCCIRLVLSLCTSPQAINDAHDVWVNC